MDQVLLDEFLKECGLTDPFRVEVDFKGDSSTQFQEYRQPFLVIGRRAGSDMLLDHWLVSRRHAYLQLIEGRFCCVDLGSRTGTHGGDATERAGWLEPGRAIQIGPYAVRPELPPVSDRDYPPLPVVTWTITSPTDEPSFWTMNRGIALIGRSPACRIRLHEGDVSRFHCSLVLTTGGAWAVDLLSQRPVLVNGRTVRLARVEPGDELRIGRHILIPEYDYSLVKVPVQRPTPGGTPSVASTRPPDPATDHLPALNPTVIPPGLAWNRPEPLAVPGGDLSQGIDPTVNSLVQQFGAMQQQMFDQFHQTMMMMFEGFAALHRETSSSIRAEFDEVRKLSQEIESLRAETAKLAEATTLSIQQPAFQRVNQPPDPGRNGRADRPDEPPKPAPPTFDKVVLPLPDSHVDIHAQLCQRLNTIETERQSRWQKILGMMAAKS